MPPEDLWNGERYARHSSLQEAMAAQVLGWIDLRGDERVLDLGCGDGRISARIAAEQVPRGSVLVIDPSLAMIDHASRTHAGLPNLRFEVGDARGMGFQQRFDPLGGAAGQRRRVRVRLPPDRPHAAGPLSADAAAPAVPMRVAGLVAVALVLGLPCRHTARAARENR